MTEYSNTVQLTQGKGVNLVASATETPGVLRRGKPLSMLPLGACTDWRALSRRTMTGPAIRAKAPVNRAAGQGEDYLTYEVSAVSRMTQTR